MSAHLFAELLLRSEPGRCYTYEEIGLEMGISGERVRQIEMCALRKLARVERFRKLLREMVEP